MSVDLCCRQQKDWSSLASNESHDGRNQLGGGRRVKGDERNWDGGEDGGWMGGKGARERVRQRNDQGLWGKFVIGLAGVVDAYRRSTGGSYLRDRGRASETYGAKLPMQTANGCL